MQKIIFVISTVLILGLTGCAPTSHVQESMNIHGNSLYAYKKNPSEETLDNHIRTLEKIIFQSESYGQRVPPGIYFEYGFFLLQTDPLEAKKCLLREKELYPESSVFINNILEMKGL